MLKELQKIQSIYTRMSKLKKVHTYNRIKTVAVFQCDECYSQFQRDVSSMDRRRISNDYYHVCSRCDSKRFAQKKGVERRRIWKITADNDIAIDRL